MRSGKRGKDRSDESNFAKGKRTPRYFRVGRAFKESPEVWYLDLGRGVVREVKTEATKVISPRTSPLLGTAVFADFVEFFCLTKGKEADPDMVPADVFFGSRLQF